MANIAITAASVLASGQASTETQLAGVALTAGQYVYKEAATGTFKLADCDSATAEVRNVYGVTLNGAGIGQPVTVAKSDSAFVPGGTLTKGAVYVLSATAGSMCPLADLITTNDVVMLGIATSTTVLNLRPFAPGVTL
jgi:hypothetical protein